MFFRRLLVLVFSLGMVGQVFGDSLTPIADKYGTDKGTLSHLYTRHYDQLFMNMRENNLKLLEIGVLRGASINMWLEYFPKAQIYGIDNRLASIVNRRAILFQGDQSDPVFLKKVCNDIQGDLDIIVDDGLHAFYHQQISLLNLFSKLKPGGLYIIEDLHWQPYAEPNIVHTRDLLKDLRLFSKCSYINQEQVDQLINSIDNIRWFDSAQYGKDCLAVIQKK